MTQPPVALCGRRTIFSAPDPFDQLVVLGLLATTPYCSNRAFDTAKGNNELVNAAAGHTLTYDGRGNLTGDGVRSYTYAADGSGRMLRAKTTGGASATYQYDPFGRRTNKTVGGVTTRFMFDSTNVEIGEYDGTGHLLRRLLHRPDFAAPVAFADAAGNITYEATDRLGSVVATIAAGGTTTNTYGYLPYGDTPSGTLSGTAFGYAGYRYDAETGTYHTATRSYDPRLGRATRYFSLPVSQSMIMQESAC